MVSNQWSVGQYAVGQSERTDLLTTDLLIIGYGNPLREDDGVGWRVAEAAAEALPGAAVLTAHQLTPELSEPISRAGRVVFIDAAAEGIAGEVYYALLPPATDYRPGSHESTPDGLLALAAALFGRCPPAYMLTIVGHAFGLGEALSPAVEAAIPIAVRLIVESPVE